MTEGKVEELYNLVRRIPRDQFSKPKVLAAMIAWSESQAHAPTPAPPPNDYDVRPFDKVPEQHIHDVNAWLISNDKAASDVRWSLYPIGMVQRWIERAKSAEATSPPPEEGGWISVKDRLPARYDKVLSYAQTTGMIEVNYVLNTRDEEFAWNYSRSSVTDWRPLPSPPSSKEKP